MCHFLTFLSSSGQAAGSHRPGSLHALFPYRGVSRGEPTAEGFGQLSADCPAGGRHSRKFALIKQALHALTASHPEGSPQQACHWRGSSKVSNKMLSSPLQRLLVCVCQTCIAACAVRAGFCSECKVRHTGTQAAGHTWPCCLCICRCETSPPTLPGRTPCTYRCLCWLSWTAKTKR